MVLRLYDAGRTTGSVLLLTTRCVEFANRRSLATDRIVDNQEDQEQISAARSARPVPRRSAGRRRREPSIEPPKKLRQMSRKRGSMRSFFHWFRLPRRCHSIISRGAVVIL